MPVTLPRTLASQMDRFVGRTWLLPRLLDWWARGEERVLVLTGGPGAGKSSILAWLAGHGPLPQNPHSRDALLQLRAAVRAAHFCQAASRNATPTGFAENAAQQLARSVPGFGDALAGVLAERVQVQVTQNVGTVAAGGRVTGVQIERLDLGTLGEETSFDRAFARPLQALYATGHAEPMLLLVDALDEAQAGGGQATLPGLLAGLDDLPAQVRILATMRDEPRVQKLFRRARRFDLREDAGAGSEDLRAYAEARLATLSSVDDGRRREFARQLADRAGGSFLYARVVLDEALAAATPGLPDLAAAPLPEGLGGLYHDFLTRELGRDESRWFDLYEPLLGLIAVAHGPGLTTRQLQSLVGQDVRQALRCCKQYLEGELPEGPFRPFHKSFADFLLEDEENLDYRIDAAGMHRRIAEHYWTAHRADWSACDDYGLEALAGHVAQAGLAERLRELVGPDWMQARVRRQGLRYGGFVADLDLAWQLARGAAEREIAADETEFRGFAECFRLALLRTSVNTLSAEYPLPLVVRAVETGVWNPARALDLARNIPKPQDRARLCAALLALREPRLTEAERQDAVESGLAAARAISYLDELRAEALASMLPWLDRPTRTAVLEEALGAARRIESDAFRAQAYTRILAAVGEEATQSLQEEADAAARSVADPYFRASALAGLADCATGSRRHELIEAALAAADDVSYEPSLSSLIAELAPQLDDAQRERAMALALRLVYPLPRGDALQALAARATEPQLRAMHEAARGIDDSATKARLLGRIAQRLPAADRAAVAEEALTEYRELPTYGDRVRVLRDLLPLFPGSSAVAMLDEVLAAVPKRDPDHVRADSLLRLAAMWPQDGRAVALEQAAVAIRSTGKRRDLGHVVERNASILQAPQVEAALAGLSSIPDEWPRAQLLGVLADELPPARREAVTAFVRETALRALDEPTHPDGYARVARLLSGPALGELLARIVEIDDDRRRGELLAAIAPWLDEAQFEMASRAAPVDESGARPAWIEREAPAGEEQAEVPDEALLDAACAAVEAVADPWQRAQAFADLVGLVPVHRQPGILAKALEACAALRDPGPELGVLGKLRRHANEAPVRAAIRRAMLDYLDEKRAEGKRADLLHGMLIGDFLRPPVIGARCAAALVALVADADAEWRWL